MFHLATPRVTLGGAQHLHGGPAVQDLEPLPNPISFHGFKIEVWSGFQGIWFAAFSSWKALWNGKKPWLDFTYWTIESCCACLRCKLVVVGFCLFEKELLFYFHFNPPEQIRMGKAKEDRTHRKQAEHYVGSARNRIVLQAAAQAWSQGVPWAHALRMCKKAISKADAKAKPLPRRANARD